MNRRDFLKHTGIAALAAARLSSTAFSASNDGNAAERPNIVLIMADDMGYSDIGCFGGEIDTPNLDALAAGGLRFTQFYNAARCCPTRASLLTGLYSHQAGIGHMVDDRGMDGYRGRLNERCVTLAEVLRQSGYLTFMAGKWHVSYYDYLNPEPTLHRQTWPLQRGFDHFFGTLAGAGSFYSPVSLMRDNTFIEPDKNFYYTDAINNEAARYIEQADTARPLFLYVAQTAPHWPLHAREQNIAKYKESYNIGWDAARKARYDRMLQMGLIKPQWRLSERDSSTPPWQETPDKDWQSRRMAVYAAMVDVMDRGIGKVIDALKKTGRFENTLILFLSDNGGCAEIIKGTNTRHGTFARGGTRPEVMPGPPDTYASVGPSWANVNNTPFRKFKSWTHEGGIAAPLIAHWPKGISSAGQLSSQVGHVIDIMATCVDVAGAAYPAQFNGNDITPMEGVSLRPAFQDKPLQRSSPLYWEHEGNWAIRNGQWKLVCDGPGGPWELYDIDADRTELNNLAEQRPEKVRELAAQWCAWGERALVLPWPWKPQWKPQG